MKLYLRFHKTNERYEAKNAEKIDNERLFYIEDYMFKEAKVRPVKNFVSYIVDEDEWVRGTYSGFTAKADIVEQDVARFTSDIVLMKRAKDPDFREKPYGYNGILVHEALGHLGFEKYISTRRDERARRLSETFSRILDSFVDKSWVHGTTDIIG